MRLMSDGKFNRALLPRTDFQSGVRFGKSVAMRCAESAFEQVLDDVFAHATDVQKEAAREAFLRGLHAKD